MKRTFQISPVPIDDHTNILWIKTCLDYNLAKEIDIACRCASCCGVLSAEIVENNTTAMLRLVRQHSISHRNNSYSYPSDESMKSLILIMRLGITRSLRQTIADSDLNVAKCASECFKGSYCGPKFIIYPRNMTALPEIWLHILSYVDFIDWSIIASFCHGQALMQLFIYLAGVAYVGELPVFPYCISSLESSRAKCSDVKEIVNIRRKLVF